MKTLKNNLKQITYLFAFLIFLQSCVTIYKSQPLTLEEVNDRHIKTKVLTKSGETLKFKNISFENGTYYGANKKKGKTLKVPLQKEAIREIKIKDKALSTIINIPLIFVYVIGVSVVGITYQYW